MVLLSGEATNFHISTSSQKMPPPSCSVQKSTPRHQPALREGYLPPSRYKNQLSGNVNQLSEKATLPVPSTSTNFQTMLRFLYLVHQPTLRPGYVLLPSASTSSKFRLPSADLGINQLSDNINQLSDKAISPTAQFINQL